MADEKVVVSLEATGNAAAAIDAVVKKLDALEQTVSKGQNSFKKAGEVFAGVFSSHVLISSIEKVGEVAHELFQIFVVEGIHAAEEAGVAVNRLGTAFALAGKNAEDSVKDFEHFAEALQDTTTLSKDAVIEAGALLESLARLDSSGLKKATQAAADLAAALHIDLETAVRLVGKAANGEVGSFTRYGLSIQKGNTDAETFSNTLKTLESRFGGAAQAQVNTYAGAIAQAQNKFKELQETVGRIVVNNQSFIQFIKISGDLIARVTEVLKENNKEYVDLAGQGLLLFTSSVSAALQITSDFVSVLDILKNTVILLTSPLGAISAALTALTGDFTSAGKEIRAVGKAVDDAFTGLLHPATAFKDEIKLVDGITAKLGVTVAEVRDGIDTAGNKFVKSAEQVREFSDAEKAAGEEGKKLIEKIGASTPLDEFNKKLNQIELALSQKLISEKKAAEGSKAIAEEADAAEAERLQKRNESLLQLNNDLAVAEVDRNNIRINEIVAQEELKNSTLLQLNQDYATGATDIDRATSDQILAGQVALSDKLIKVKADQNKKEDAERKKNVDSLSNSFGQISSLTQTKDKDLFELGKAAAIAQATIGLYTGVANALAGPPTGPPFPLNYIAAVAQAVASGVQIANIAGTHLKTGITSVPGFGNSDNFPAVLAPQERVISKDQNRDLTNFLSTQQDTRDLLMLIAHGVNNDRPINVSVGGEQIFNVVNEQVRNGRRLSA